MPLQLGRAHLRTCLLSAECAVLALTLLVGCQATGVITAIAQIAVSPPVVDFGTVPLQSSSQREVVISNTGAAPLSIASITLTPTGSAFACEGCRAQTLQPQEQATVTIRFTPADASPAVGRLAVVSDAPNAPEVLVSLAGNGGPSSSCTKETDAAFCKRLGRTCGAVTAPDNCGAMRTVPSCGTCTAPALCGNSNVCGCTAETDDALCLAHGAQCGPLTVTDRCNATRVITSCGMCANEHDTCGGAGTPGQCGCTPDSDTALCSRFNRHCGTFTVTDTCGTSRTIASCGTCTGPQTCGASNVCGCVAETDEALCARKGYVCGQLTATDNCGATRIVNSCGTCTNSVDSCGGGGTLGACGCTPETDAQLCAQLSKACGAATTTDRCGGARSVSSCGLCSAAPAHGSPLCTMTNSGATSCDFTCDDGYVKTGHTCSIGCVGSSLTRTPFVAGAGTTNDPYLICTAAQLDRVRDFSKANFRLLGDVDLVGLPFEPIGDATSKTFDGAFDGGGFRILNWHYSAPAVDHLGLFEKITGSVKALRLVGLEVTGHDNVGALAGSGSGTITDVRASASTVTGHDLVGGLIGTHTWLMTGCVADVTVNGHSFVGGLVGYETGWIESSSAAGAVTSTGERAGGLVGMIYGSSSVYSVYRSFATGDVNGVDAVGGLLGEGAKSNTSVGTSYATGSVTGTSNVGGLVGSSNVPITNSFSAGAVTGVSAVGGLVGANNSLIGHCYSRGAVTGTTGVGGLVGTNSTAPLALAADSFWDTTASGQTTSAVGIGKTTTELFDASTYAKWNKYTTWQVGGAYPSFASERATCVVGPSAFSSGAGTEASPYLITEPGQIYHIGCNLGSTYKLANDLDFNGHSHGAAHRRSVEQLFGHLRRQRQDDCELGPVRRQLGPLRRHFWHGARRDLVKRRSRGLDWRRRTRQQPLGQRHESSQLRRRARRVRGRRLGGECVWADLAKLVVGHRGRRHRQRRCFRLRGRAGRLRRGHRLELFCDRHRQQPRPQRGGLDWRGGGGCQLDQFVFDRRGDQGQWPEFGQHEHGDRLLLGHRDERADQERLRHRQNHGRNEDPQHLFGVGLHEHLAGRRRLVPDVALTRLPKFT